MQQWVDISEGMTVDSQYVELLRKMRLGTIDQVFAYTAGSDLHKQGLAGYRSRRRLTLESKGTYAYLKRYEKPPKLAQLKNWLMHRKIASTAYYDYQPTIALPAVGVNTPKTIAVGRQWSGLFERRSFILSEEIPHAHSLESRLPECFYGPTNDQKTAQKRAFLQKTADFVHRFHAAGYRHRDLYLCHIFCDQVQKLYLIDLARVFKPRLTARRYQVKDLAQLYYSAPGSAVSRADRLRFYKYYCRCSKLASADKRFIAKVLRRVKKMRTHDAKRGKAAAFAQL